MEKFIRFFTYLSSKSQNNFVNQLDKRSKRENEERLSKGSSSSSDQQFEKKSLQRKYKSNVGSTSEDSKSKNLNQSILRCRH